MVVPPLSIGNLNLDSCVLMAPMCGLTTRPFRILARRHGCALSAAEMIAAEHLVRASEESRRRYAVTPAERPVTLQVVGARPEAMADSAAMLEDLGADVVDVNMGCPVRRIVKGGGGSALMREPALAARIVRAMVRRVRVPVTVKLRAGTDEGCLNAADVARVVAEEGAAAVSVHARTPGQRHRGSPRLEVIREVAAAVRVPVVGNGGVRTADDARTMLRETRCAGVMVGRAAIGDVWIFERLARALDGAEPAAPPGAEERADVLQEHLELLVREYGAERAVLMFRKCVPHYLRGTPGAREARHRLVSMGTPRDVVRAAREALLAQSSPKRSANSGSSGSTSSSRLDR